jgi:hypothetical protein
MEKVKATSTKTSEKLQKLLTNIDGCGKNCRYVYPNFGTGHKIQS